MAYTGRFAPSPTGPLHAGSVAAALASWLDARAHRGRWLVRLEDTDTPRCVPGAEAMILAQLAALGLVPDEAPLRQSTRGAVYQQALNNLLASGHAYPCGCTRQAIDDALAAAGTAHRRHGERIYPGTCRSGLHGLPARAVRLRTARADRSGGDGGDGGGTDTVIEWQDRRLGAMRQNVTQDVGDFVLRRADGLWAYQLAVVVDDAAQGVTHVVRGADLADNTARQMALQRALGLPTPRYLHTPLVLAADGHKLSKQNGAVAVDSREALATLVAAGQVLGVVAAASSTPNWLAAAVSLWRARWVQV